MSRRGGNDLLGPWEGYRKAMLAGVLAVVVFLTILVTLPIGFSALMLIVAAAKIWKPIGAFSDPRLGTYMVGTPPYKVAMFFTGYKAMMRSLFSPRVALGFGPPREDKDHGYAEGSWLPPFRMAAMWALVAALIMALLDYPLQFVRFPFWHGGSLPWFISYGFSVVGWFVVFQTCSDLRRIQADGNGIVGLEPAPATMLNRVNLDIKWSKVIGRSLALGIIPVAFIVIICIWLRYSLLEPLALTALVLSQVLTMLATISIMLRSAYRTKWAARCAQRETWNQNLSFFRDNTPIFVSQMQLPTLEEWQSGNPSEDEPYAPKVSVATFMFPPAATFWDYSGFEEKINGALNASISAIAPLADQDPDTGEDIPGSVGSKGFRIWWTEEILSIQDVLNPDTDNWLRELGVRALILPKVAQIRGIGYCTLIRWDMMTRKTSSAHIMEIRVVPPANTSLGTILSNIASLQNILGVPWIRAVQEQTVSSGHVINIMIGADPVSEGIKFVNPASMSRKVIDIANWSYYFNVNGLIGDSGAPRLLDTRNSSPDVSELVFDLPAGLSYGAISTSVPKLKTTSGNQFIESSLGSSDKDSKRKELMKRGTTGAKQSGLSQSKFTMVASKESPLNKMFKFSDFKKDVVAPRISGQEKMTWAPGVMANGELALDDFNGTEPHLLIAGSSGSGKSVVIQNMILQLASNNGPDDLRFWMIEPKIGLQRFRHLDLTDRFVDSWTGFDGAPDEDFFQSVADLSEAAVDELKRRNRVLAEYNPRNRKMIPEKLAEAREIARREGPDPDTGEPHPMMMPFMVIVVEECATIFADAPSKEDSDLQKVILSNFGRIAREGRSAGIHMVMTTQYPTNASIPSLFRKQMRRIGLACQDSMASQVVIGQNGLETTDMRSIKGSGMVLNGIAGYRMFRGFLLEGGNPDIGEPNDVVDIVESLPKNAMADGSAKITYGSNNQLIVDAPSPEVFEFWSSKTGVVLDAAIDKGKPTKDIE